MERHGVGQTIETIVKFWTCASSSLYKCMCSDSWHCRISSFSIVQSAAQSHLMRNVNIKYELVYLCASSRLLDVLMQESRLYLIFEFLSMDLKKYLDSIPSGQYMDSMLVKVSITLIQWCNSCLNLKLLNLRWVTLADNILHNSWAKFLKLQCAKWVDCPTLHLCSTHGGHCVDESVKLASVQWQQHWCDLLSISWTFPSVFEVKGRGGRARHFIQMLLFFFSVFFFSGKETWIWNLIR